MPAFRLLLAARLGLGVLALVAIGWAASVIPRFWSEAALAQTAAHIIAGETFRPDTFAAVVVELENKSSTLRPSVFSEALVIEVRAVEEAMRTADGPDVDVRLARLQQMVEDSLANVPSDSFLWLVRFWVENVRLGFSPDHLRDLRMSYTLGPNEAWIAVKRNPYALGVFSQLTPDLSAAVIGEFAGLVRSGLASQAADILAHAPPSIRRMLVGQLAAVPESDRRDLARLLRERDIDDASVPGIAPQPERSWR
jgi:hypothetical protein